MGQRFQSGAFVQQCFAVHPLCLSLKRIDAEGRLLVSLHLLPHDAPDGDYQIVARVAAVPLGGEVISAKALPTAKELLTTCVQTHPEAVTIRELDVIRDNVGLRCGECRRMYDLQVSMFESHQKS